ncbi:MAG: 6-phosphofructokinase [Armatimonadota bacterium]|nr:MAG: 6-phosphofructokinase [Armatimonadota bacterium]
MTTLRGNCLMGQSGGPTAVINASICGVIQEAMKHSEIQEIYGAQHGILGVLQEDLIDLRREDAEEIELLKCTPAAALGSIRHKLPDPDQDASEYERIFQVFEAHNIRYFFYAGGNDSMDTINKICAYAEQVGYDLRAVGIPKTVDNDLAGIDHCPGYGSVAKHIAAITLGVGLDMQSVHLTDPVVIMEVMGRNAGWMTASSALARSFEGDAPNLIYVPEAPWNRDRFLDDVRRSQGKHGWCFIAVSVGTKDESGGYLATQKGEYAKDAFGHVQLGGAGPFLEDLVRGELGLKTRLIRMGPAERIAMHFASLTDRDEAYGLGAFAVQSGINGITAKMVSLERKTNEPYQCELTLSDLEIVANEEKLIPREWLNEAGNDVTQDFVAYARPLIEGEVPTPIENGLPRYARLREVRVEQRLLAWPK